jgi:hypothetical protein
MNNKWQSSISGGLSLYEGHNEKLYRYHLASIHHGYSVQNLHIVLHLLHCPIVHFVDDLRLQQGFKPICECGTFLAFLRFTLPARKGVNKQKESIMKKWNVTMIVAGLMIASMTFAGGSSAALIDDMAALDRDYVAALVLSNQPDKPAEAVTASMKRLTESWKKFVNGLSLADRDNKSLKSAISQISGSVAEAEKLAVAGKRKDAHEALEMVRIVFWKTRSDMSISYLLDLHTAFHEPMEAFVSLAEKPGADQAKLKSLLAELSEKWSVVEKAKLDTKLFNLNEEKITKYNGLVKKEREILTSLVALIDGKDQAALAKTAGTVKTTFSQTYMIFGDFSSLGL